MSELHCSNATNTEIERKHEKREGNSRKEDDKEGVETMRDTPLHTPKMERGRGGIAQREGSRACVKIHHADSWIQRNINESGVHPRDTVESVLSEG